MYNIALNQSFQNPSVRNSAIVAIAGSDIGKTIFKKSVHSDAPSIFADSTTASGTVVLKNVLRIIIWNELTHIGSINAHIVFLSPKNFVTTKYDATIPPENNIGMKINFVKNFLYAKFFLDSA